MVISNLCLFAALYLPQDGGGELSCSDSGGELSCSDSGGGHLKALLEGALSQ